MTKIKEIYQKFNFNCDEVFFEQAMKEYAEQYAQTHQDNILNSLQFIYGDVDVEGTSHSEIVDLDYESVPNLPDHD